ncbi:hypothetical protein SCUCBS95973_003047 [Sporothrix curviconia]|uniref:Ras modification protein ERF4 n=1 Tax=Sporothrix curviconia TaxID=1260050 RepID=A0ABP0BCE0_9PEZI
MPLVSSFPGGPLGSRPPPLVPTASHATNAHSVQAFSSQKKQQTVLPSRPSALPHRPSVPLDYPQPPFRNRAADTLQRPLRRLSTARLWNPTNSTPRGVASPSTTLRQQQQQNATQSQPQRLPSGAAAASSSARRRAPSTPPPPAVPLSHPVFHDDTPVAKDDPVGTGAADYPLLTLPEQRQIRHSSSPRASLQVERAGSEKRVSLPRSVRHSYDSKRLSLQPPDAESISAIVAPDAVAPSASRGAREDDILPASRQEDEDPNSRPTSTATAEPAFGLTLGHSPGSTKQAKGKGKAIPANILTMAASIDEQRPGEAGRSFSKDLERGPDIMGHHHGHDEGHNHRNSTASLPDGMGIGSAISSSNSSIMGDPDAQQDIGEEWGPQHPCFPHRNPHVSVDDPEYISTRIIRIRRDWLIMGDLAPTFSNLYPEILDPAGMNEPEFRRVIDKLNSELTVAFAPWSARNIVDGFLGLVTGWLWEDLGLTGAKARLARLERWIEAWNREMARTADEGAPVPPKIIPLRQTGYMTLDIQIGDPEIAPEPPSTPALSRSEMPLAATAAS